MSHHYTDENRASDKIAVTLRRMREASDRINAMRRDRMRMIWGEAFGRETADLDFCCIHNASISEAGKGWRAGGDRFYHAARRIKRIEADTSPNEIIDRYYKRVTSR